jgi:hypothetical protein
MKQDRLRASIFSVSLDLSQTVPGRLEVCRPIRHDFQDNSTIRMPQKLRNGRSDHIALGIDECQESSAAIEAEVSQILLRQVPDATADALFEKWGRLAPNGTSLVSIALDDGRSIARFLSEFHVLDIR